MTFLVPQNEKNLLTGRKIMAPLEELYWMEIISSSINR